MIKDPFFQNDFFFQSNFFALFIKENPGGQNYPANGAIMAACAINHTKGIEKPNVMLGFLFFGMRIIFRKEYTLYNTCSNIHTSSLSARL